MPTIITRYGHKFDRDLVDDNGEQIWDDLGVELWALRKGAEFLKSHGKTLSEQYETVRGIIWPNLDNHEWSALCRDEISTSKITVIMGCASSGKTHTPSWMFLLDYWSAPHETCVLVSSTQVSSLKKRVWAEMTMLWQQGVEKFPRLSGHLLDSAIAITSDSLEDCDPGQRKARDMRKGIFGIACVVGGKNVGLSRYVGIKQKRMRLIADEAQFMADGFLSAFSNLNNNEDFKACVLGNPLDILDPLGKAAEPKGGWTEDTLEPKITTCWDTRFMNGRCVNLVGTDSPNFKYPKDKPRYKYLISQKKIDEVLSFFPKDSIEYYSQCLGVMKIGTAARRILSRDLCERMGALGPAKWRSTDKTYVYFLDSSYGGDRPVAGYGCFGPDIDGKIILSFGTPKIIPLIVGSGKEPEEQLAEFVKSDCTDLGIPPENMGHDATGRGSLGTALARIWSSATNPVEAGGKPTDRPVSSDIFIQDEETGMMRLKRCDEHYDRLVSEFNFSVRYAVEAGQIRDLPEEVMNEFCARKWDIVRGDKRSVEVKDGTATRPGFKQRMGFSPDLADWAAGIVEMARRKGFIIAKLDVSNLNKPDSDWFEKEQKALEKIMAKASLQHGATSEESFSIPSWGV